MYSNFSYLLLQPLTSSSGYTDLSGWNLDNDNKVVQKYLFYPEWILIGLLLALQSKSPPLSPQCNESWMYLIISESFLAVKLAHNWPTKCEPLTKSDVSILQSHLLTLVYGPGKPGKVRFFFLIVWIWFNYISISFQVKHWKMMQIGHIHETEKNFRYLCQVA